MSIALSPVLAGPELRRRDRRRLVFGREIGMTTENETSSLDRPATTNDLNEGRRTAMLRLAKYTAPTMLALLLSDKAMAATSLPVG